jgi:hypothetical protein
MLMCMHTHYAYVYCANTQSVRIDGFLSRVPSVEVLLQVQNTHTHTYIHIHATHKKTHTHKYYITCMHAYIHTYIDGFLSHILCMIWMYTHDMNMHASMHKYTHKYIFIYTHTNIYTYQYACIHAHKHAYMNRWFSVAHTFRGAAVAGAALPLPLPHCSSPRSCVSPFVDGRLITCVHIRHAYIHILHT